MSAQPRLVVSAPSSGHGKTAIAVGLLAACAARGIPAAGFKVGPDHTDAAYLGLAAGRPGRNLDPRLVGAQRIAPLFGHGASGAKFSVIEGAMGLFDSLTGQPEVDGTAAVAATLRAPVVLVVDVATMGHSLAALVHGFRMFDEMVHLGGVILNRVASPRHEQMLRTALDDIGMPVLGALRRGDLPNVLPARSHGPVPVAHRTVEASRAVRRLGEAVAGSLDLERLMALAAAAPALPAPIWTPADAVGGEIFEQRPLVALAGGPGAPYTYVETAELLTAAGADVAVVDPLRDETLPAGTRALIVGAGLPEGYAEELSANRRLCNTVAKFAHDGWPVVAEGVALPWLARDFDGRPMCAVFDASAVTGEQTVAGYREATAPTTSPLAPAGARITGYKQHRAVMTPRAGAVPAWTWSGGTPEGFVWRQVHASQLGLHWAAAPEIAKRLVAAAIAGPAGHQGSAHPPTAVLIGQIVQPGPSQVLQGQIIIPNRPEHDSPIPFDAPGPQVVYDVASSPGPQNASEPEVYYDPRGTEIIYDVPDSRTVYDVPDSSGADLYDAPASRGSRPHGSPVTHDEPGFRGSQPHGSPVSHDTPGPQEHRDAPGPRESHAAPAFSDSAGPRGPYGSPVLPESSGPYGSPGFHETRGSRGFEDPYDESAGPSAPRGAQGSYGSSGPHDSPVFGPQGSYGSSGPHGSPAFGEATGSRGSQAAPGSSIPHEPSASRGGHGSYGSPVFGEASGPRGPQSPHGAPGSPAAYEPSASHGGQGSYDSHGSPHFGESPGSGGSYDSSGPHGSPASHGSPGPHDSPVPRGSQDPHDAPGSSGFPENPGPRGSQGPYDWPGPRASTDSRESFRPQRPTDSRESYEPRGFADSRESVGPHSSSDSRESFRPDGPGNSREPFAPDSPSDSRESFGPGGSADLRESFGPGGSVDPRESFGPGGSADLREPFGPGGSVDPREPSGARRHVDPRDLFESSDPADLYAPHGHQVPNGGPFPPGSPHEAYASRSQPAPHGPATPGSPYPQATGSATSRPQPVSAGRPGPAGGAAEPVNLADTADIITS